MTGYFTQWTQTHLSSKKQVPGVPSVPAQEKALSDKDNSGTQCQDYGKVQSVPYVPDKNKSVPLKASNSNAYSNIGTQEHKEHDKSNDTANAQRYKNFFEERAGIAEFDGCQSRTEAEVIAYKDTLSEWIYNNPPAEYKITHCAYCSTAIDFSNGGFQAWGAVYCCYHSQDNEHLRPYLQSRLKEAKAYLKTININQPIYEV